jgi:hypothetical protein
MNIQEIANAIQETNNLAYTTYKPMVEDIVARNASESEVEHLLDDMVGLTGDDRMLQLFKKVCRRYYEHYPEMIASAILFYKEMYEEE